MTAEPATIPATASEGASPAPAPATGRLTRWSDWLNPIVVREVQQALKGRVFVLSVLIACIVVITIAITVASGFDPGSSGRNAFDAGLATLVPLLIFVVPMQAYQSMRHELKAGMVEQLLLSELRPRRIIAGKLTAAMVQFVLYVSVLSPLLATSYLLRGVDMATIGISLVFAALFCVTATAFAISSAAQAMVPAMQGLANLAVAVGLAMASFGLIGFIGSGEYARSIGWLLSSNELSMVTSSLLLGGAASCSLSGLTAASFLAHAYENKSTGFRVFLLALVGAVFGWVALFVPTGFRDEFYVVMTMVLLIGAAVFGVFMVTEQARLSPRVRAHVPKNAALALLAVPLLPGRHRGMLCYLLAGGVIALVASLVWPTGSSFFEEARRFALFVASYSVIYLSIGKWVRGKLPPSVQGNHLGRFLVPFVLFLFCIVPVLIDAFVQGGVRRWHAGHIMNPFWTIERHAFRSPDAGYLYGVATAALVFLVLQLPSVFSACREVLRASAKRRAPKAAQVQGSGGD